MMKKALAVLKPAALGAAAVGAGFAGTYLAIPAVATVFDEPEDNMGLRWATGAAVVGATGLVAGMAMKPKNAFALTVAATIGAAAAASGYVKVDYLDEVAVDVRGIFASDDKAVASGAGQARMRAVAGGAGDAFKGALAGVKEQRARHRVTPRRV